ncbi:helix-turn-helix domain-containing protein [Actinokineospora sp. UTMC 2448]|uniref:helix-turn-helix domain-containing protein n=1 Tax=Actinokineospora sp. UTMC 2448 TaxID=2268449 RepID=UPI0021643510|nr:helix-turn-helix domain-containing protein [Actinokineospora sp. UTMC 2448]UVS82639.1 DNA binding domain, excisionase family [Actinokineospora sp. UTMC 2448]
MPAVTELEERTLLPPEPDTRDQEELSNLLARLPREEKARLVGPDGTETEIPDEVYRTLRQVIDALVKGKAITIAPHDTMLTTQQAADMLGISRPTLVKLLEKGDIAFEKPGRHRRIRLADLVAYRDRARERRRLALRELTQEADDDGLYDTGTGFVPTR